MIEPTWVRRFHATRISFPTCARDASHHLVYQSNDSGTAELYAWDRRLDRHVRLTDRPEGTRIGGLTPDGGWIWWFDDNDGDEQGRWMRQPFDVSANPAPADPAVPDLPPGYPVGLALGRTLAAVGLSNRGGVHVFLHRYAGPTTSVYSSPRHASAKALSHDDSLLAVDHAEHGDACHPSVRVFRIDPDGTGVETVGELGDGPDRGLRARAFAPGPGDARLLLQHERHGRSAPLVWDVEKDDQRELDLDLAGELYAWWYPDGRALLVQRHWQARDELYRYDLSSEGLTRLETPRGSLHGSAVRPDGRLELLWSAADQPPALLSEAGTPVLTSPRPAPPSSPLTDAWVDGPGGKIHALVVRPSDGGPRPTLFWLHGGPGGEMVDGFDPVRAAFVEAGYCVIHLNYRGSSGYGSAWRDAIREAPGLVELEDVAAVRDWAVDEGIATPDGCVITGMSWGGYLTLLALGTQPERWAAGIADVPIGNLVGLYEDEMEPVREHDRSLFGGTPEEIPEKWARSNPLTYAEHVRAPLLVLASSNDPRCPIRQIDTYLARLDELGTPYEQYRFDAGHFSLVAAERVRQMRLQLDFLARHLPG